MEQKIATQKSQGDSVDRLTVLNFFGGPSVGKSATRSGLFWLMKVKGMSVEEVSEYAKFLVLSGREWQLAGDQLSVMASQHHKMLILQGKYQYAVTDSPLMLASFYAPKATPPAFGAMCEQYAAQYDNVNFFLTRDFSRGGFESQGRIHNQEDSLRIAGEQKEFLAKLGQQWVDLEIDDAAPWSILESLESLRPGSVPLHGPQKPMPQDAAPSRKLGR